MIMIHNVHPLNEQWMHIHRCHNVYFFLVRLGRNYYLNFKNLVDVHLLFRCQQKDLPRTKMTQYLNAVAVTLNVVVILCVKHICLTAFGDETRESHLHSSDTDLFFYYSFISL